ncbi:MAG TPA: 2-C-methyl-D-erythritol 4-phosphate cytidylyltransferase [Parachlamydiaceae bacterium]|nr:2-C-methyl-D-erythritol 4-phosphate cytidylyltransferase [Parachlamydiaceae bacterium]
MKRVSVILLAGGKGSRMETATPKQFLQLGNKPLLFHSLEFFQNFSYTHEMIIVCEKEYQTLFHETNGIGIKFAAPGNRRQDSVFNGLKEVDPLSDLILIHDGARPFLNEANLLKAIDEAALHGAAALAVPLKFTVKEKDENGTVLKTVDRASLFEVQTPQIIEQKLLWEGFQFAQQHGLEVTDDLSLIELLNKPAKLVMGSYQNIKITTKEDLAFAKVLLENMYESVL